MATLTAKELSSLQDQLDYEKLLVKKYKAYACQLEDPQIKSKCEQIAGRHQSHYNRLLNQLN